MNIAQELSIVRDNIAEYGMTNITQLEYDAIYQQGRADVLTKLWKKVISMHDDYVELEELDKYINEIMSEVE